MEDVVHICHLLRRTLQADRHFGKAVCSSEIKEILRLLLSKCVVLKCVNLVANSLGTYVIALPAKPCQDNEVYGFEWRARARERERGFEWRERKRERERERESEPETLEADE